MAEQTKTVLKGYFEAGDAPTESQFGDLIDTLYTEASAVTLDASIVRIDGDVLDLQTSDTTLDASIVRIDSDISNLDTSIGELDTLTQTHTSDIAQLDASINRIDDYFTSTFTGTFLIADGSTVNVTNGIITSVG